MLRHIKHFGSGVCEREGGLACAVRSATLGLRDAEADRDLGAEDLDGLAGERDADGLGKAAWAVAGAEGAEGRPLPMGVSLLRRTFFIGVPATTARELSLFASGSGSVLWSSRRARRPLVVTVLTGARN